MHAPRGKVDVFIIYQVEVLVLVTVVKCKRLQVSIKRQFALFVKVDKIV